MKKQIKYIAITLVALMMFACNKDSFDYKPGYVGRSKITSYPIITVKGDFYVVVPQGSTYTDPGATAKAGTADVTVKASAISTAAAGVYTETYTATNTDGFSATATRRVVVYATAASAQANDFSGNYARSTNGSIAEWTKLAPGVYSVFNPGGAPGTDLTVIAFNDTGSHVFIPSQTGSDGNTTSSAQESSTAGPGGTLLSYKWQILNPGYGLAVRTFNKQ